MKPLEKVVSLFSDRFRAASGLLGFLIGVIVFLDVSNFIIFVAASTSLGFISALVVLSIQELHDRNFRKFFKICGSTLLIVVVLGVFAVFSLQSCLMAVYSLDYNPLTGKCQVNTYSCTVDRPWYKSECSGEKLRDYCSRKDFPSRNISQAEALENGIVGQGSGYAACREAGYLN